MAPLNSMLATLLYCFAKAGHYQTITFFIDAGRDGAGSYTFQDLLRARNIDGDTALHYSGEANFYRRWIYFHCEQFRVLATLLGCYAKLSK